MAPEVPGEIVRDSERLTILLKRHAEKKTFTAEEDLEEAIRMARYDSFLVGPEMAAGKRVTKLRAKKRAADNGGPPLTRAEEVTLRFLGLLYPPPRRSIDERILAEHPFWETAIGERLDRSEWHRQAELTGANTPIGVSTSQWRHQAAINYHFKSKDGLYREILRDAIRALTEHQLSHSQATQAMPRERALGEFVRQQLRPLSARDDVGRYIHILNWEAVQPTAVYRKPVGEEATPFLGFAVDLMRRFMPDADRPTLIIAAVWLVGQCTVFIRHREQLSAAPVSLSFDSAVERLSILISSWALGGLAHSQSNAP